MRASAGTAASRASVRWRLIRSLLLFVSVGSGLLSLTLLEQAPPPAATSERFDADSIGSTKKKVSTTTSTTAAPTYNGALSTPNCPLTGTYANMCKSSPTP